MKCLNCGKKEAIKCTPHASGNFCSNRCAKLYSLSHIDREKKKEVCCSTCGKKLIVGPTSGKIYCEDCIPSYEYLRRREKSTIQYCLYCGKQLRYWPNRKTLYCREHRYHDPERQIRTERNRKSLKERLLDLLGGSCIICGYNKSKAALDFHHRNPEEKEFIISKFAGRKSFEEVLAEAKKCDILCSNCHRELHEKLNIEKRNKNNKKKRTKQTKKLNNSKNKKRLDKVP